MVRESIKAFREADDPFFWVNLSDAERLLSIAAGGVAAYVATNRSGANRLALATAGAGLLVRGLSGFSLLNVWMGRNSSNRARALRPLDLQTTITVNAPREEVEAFWRRLENLPRFMRHLEDVRELGEGRSHWVAVIPGRLGTVSWDAETRVDANRLSWRSVPGSVIENTGEVLFRDAPGERGTEVRARISYRPPAGRIGRATSNLLTPVFNQMVKEDIRRFKQVIEAGEVPTAKIKRERPAEAQRSLVDEVK